MIPFIVELSAAMTYLIGYALIAYLAFLHHEVHCWGYAIIIVGAILHVVIIVLLKYRKGHHAP
ncbi:hypothetical protein NA78x_001712 [Anatilimnocola sp. NA78]|uniref:hypothetical protein n=1 Tax=Anatilimnocola sp. NA78 TaxID=3415683 RepID=UPI003CE48A0C